MLSKYMRATIIINNYNKYRKYSDNKYDLNRNKLTIINTLKDSLNLDTYNKDN